MKALLKMAGAHICSVAIGVAVVGGCGALMLTDSAFNANNKKPAKAVQTPVAATKTVQVQETDNAEKKAADSTTAVELLSFMNYKKAAIGDYDMTAVESRIISDEDKTDPEDFTVEFPEDNTIIYQPAKNEPMNFTATRSVAGEYYTVHDEISGATVTMNAHELLCQMVNNEIGGTWDEDAIKAQLVAGYSYLRFNESIGLTPTVGLKSGYSSKIEKCLNAVEGQTVMYNGKIINAVYSASTAGYSTSAKNIWGVDYPYLQCVESEYDEKDPNWDYTKTYSKEEVRKLLEDKFDIELSDDVTKWFRIDRVYSVKYVDKVTIDGRDNCTLSGNGLCNLVGLKSNALTISYKDGEFTFKSCGWGHGVGLSQWGAHYYAENGWTYDQILMHYYINTTLGLSDVCTSAVNRGVQTTTTTTTTAVTSVPEQNTPDGSSQQTIAESGQPAVTTAPATEDIPPETVSDN